VPAVACPCQRADHSQGIKPPGSYVDEAIEAMDGGVFNEGMDKCANV